MQFRHLFSPIRVGTLELKNRIVMAPMAPGFFDQEFVTERAKAFYRARAQGGVGLIITGASSIIRPPRSGTKAAIWDSGMYDDKFIAGWKEMVDEIHQFDVKMGMQLTHVGRQVPQALYGAQPISSSAIPCPVCRSVPHALSVTEIEDMVKLFVDAAERCKEAGLDLVEIHGAHGYLGTQFMSAHMNSRTDKYGGDAEGRTRFVREIIRGVKKRLGKAFTVGVRINGQDNISGGATLEDAKEIAMLLTAAGADFLHISATVYGGYPPISPMAEPPGCYVSLAETVKRAVKVPVIAVGKINTPELAEEIIENGRADLVAVGRALLAEPQWAKKAKTGRPETIRRCIYCNQGCLDRLTYAGVQGKLTGITCLLNVEVGREEELKLAPATTSKRVLVIGGGPAGLEAARVAALRGHRVTVFEKEKELGGQFLLASQSPTKQHYRDAIEDLVRQIEGLGVAVRLRLEGTIRSVMEIAPEVVVIASGARPLLPRVTGIAKKNVVTYDRVLSGSFEVGERVLVVGGGSVGLETADFMGSRGKEVQVLEMTDRFGTDMGRVARFGLMRRLSANGVSMVKDCQVVGILDHGVEIVQGQQKKRIEGFDSVVVAVGACSNNSLTKPIKERIEEVYVIGDALKPRKALDAIQEGATVGRKI